MNDDVVIGIREGAMLRIEGEEMHLEGQRGGVVFRAGEEREEFEPGSDLSALLG